MFTNFWVNGRSVTKSKHRVIAEALFGACPEGSEVDHIDNDRTNNHPSNLRYITKSANNKKAYESGNRDFIFWDTNPNSLVRKHSRTFRD